MGSGLVNEHQEGPFQSLILATQCIREAIDSHQGISAQPFLLYHCKITEVIFQWRESFEE